MFTGDVCVTLRLMFDAETRGRSRSPFLGTPLVPSKLSSFVGARLCAGDVLVEYPGLRPDPMRRRLGPILIHAYLYTYTLSMFKVTCINQIHIYIYIYMHVCVPCVKAKRLVPVTLICRTLQCKIRVARETTPNLPTEIIPTKIRRLKVFGKLPLDMRIPTPRPIPQLSEVRMADFQLGSFLIGLDSNCIPS